MTDIALEIVQDVLSEMGDLKDGDSVGWKDLAADPRSRHNDMAKMKRFSSGRHN